MTNQILRCQKCGNYSMERFCKCEGECISVKPAKFSPLDKYSKQRLEYKRKTQSL